MKILHISHSDLIGGAARAAYRLHLAQVASGIESKILVRNKLSDNWTITGPSSKLNKLYNNLRSPFGHIANNLQKTSNINPHSINWLPSNWSKKINNSDADIINLHWIAGETMSIEDIGRIKKPIIWTLHDMWPFCGTEHIADYGKTARWKVGYTSDNRSILDKGIDLDRLTWQRKKKAWKNNSMHIIAPSNWMASCAESSALFKNYPINVIPNALDINTYRPLDKDFCRHILNLPINKKIILFGAVGGNKNLNKGYDLLIESLNIVAEKINSNEILCVVFGQSEPKNLPKIPFDIKWLGHLHDDSTLSLLYNAATVMIVPSRQENLPQTATEAQSCGTPVLAFNSSGLADAVEHRKTGYLANPYDVYDMASGLLWILNNDDNYKILCANSRKKALDEWDSTNIVTEYQKIYDQYRVY